MSNATIERQVIEIKGINPVAKFPKFNSGSVLTVDGTWFNVAKKVPMSYFVKGETVTVEIETNEKGYKTIVAMVGKVANSSPFPLGSVVPYSEAIRLPISTVPALPKTTVETIPAPGGEVPVKPVKRVGKLATEIASETMTKADWQAKDRRIELTAIAKSVLESPAYAQLVVGKKESEALDIGSRLFQHFVNLLS